MTTIPLCSIKVDEFGPKSRQAELTLVEVLDLAQAATSQAKYYADLAENRSLAIGGEDRTTATFRGTRARYDQLATKLFALIDG